MTKSQRSALVKNAQRQVAQMEGDESATPKRNAFWEPWLKDLNQTLVLKISFTIFGLLLLWGLTPSITEPKPTWMTRDWAQVEAIDGFQSIDEKHWRFSANGLLTPENVKGTDMMQLIETAGGALYIAPSIEARNTEDTSAVTRRGQCLCSDHFACTGTFEADLLYGNFLRLIIRDHSGTVKDVFWFRNKVPGQKDSIGRTWEESRSLGQAPRKPIDK